MTPQISVLIPVYNKVQYLEQCLKSLQKQTFPSFEIVVVDDGSTDGSAQWLSNWATQETRLRVIRQANAGVAAARNRLLSEIRSPYFTFIDADDWVMPTYLEKLYERACSQQADVVRCLFQEYNERTGTSIACDQRYRDYASHRKAPTTCMERFQAGLDDSQVWGKLIRTELVRPFQIGFCTGSVAEDVSFEILLYLQARNIYFLSDYLYCYRVEVANAITSQKAAMARGILSNLCFLSEELARRGFDLPCLYSLLLRLMIKGIRRFRHIKIEPADKQVCDKAIALIEKHRVRCYCWDRWRYGCFVRLVRHSSVKKMIFWSRILR